MGGDGRRRATTGERGATGLLGVGSGQHFILAAGNGRVGEDVRSIVT
jgi:hypothetical protein